MNFLAKALKFISFVVLAGCTMEARLNNLGSSLVGSTPDGSGTIQITAPYVNPSNVSSYPLSGACKEEGSQVEILKSTSVLGTTTCSGGTWSINLDLSSEADGVISVSARMTDSIGTAVSTSPVDVIKDTTAPDVTGLGPLADGVYGNSLSASPTLTWSATTDGGSGLDHYEIAIGTTAGATDASNWTAIGTVTSTQKSGLTLTEGTTYYPSVRAVDKAGNISVVVSGDGWIVDTTAPSLPLSFKDMNFGSILESPLMTWTAATDALAGVSGYQVALGTSPGATDVLNWQSIGSNIYGNVTGLSLTNGQIYYPSLRVIDNAGNISTATQDDGFRVVDKWKNQEPALPGYLNSSTNAVLLQPDNKRIMAGAFTTVGGEALFKGGRLNADGTRDTSFNMGTGFSSDLTSVALQSDGKIIAAGAFTAYNGTAQNHLTRLNTDGTQDVSFNIGTGLNGTPYVVALQSDGKILVGGAFSTYNGTAQNHLTRLNTDGTRDTTFNIGTGFDSQVHALALQGDGKILVGGAFFFYNGANQNGLTRLNTDGTRDTTFTIGTGFNFAVRFITIQSDGKILVGGDFTSYNGTSQNRITRLNSDGTIDATFNIGTGFNNVVFATALQGDGKIVVGGSFTSYNGTTQNRITRLNSDGTIDATFNIGTGFLNSSVFSISLQSDGKVLIGGGFASYSGTPQGRITRLNADGTQDTTFNTGTGFNAEVTAIVLQGDGKILVGGWFTVYNAFAQSKITRLNADGTRDTAFNIGMGFNTTVNTLALQSDGKILAGGFFTSYNGTTQSKITRLNADGTRDTAFNIGTGFNNTVNFLTLQSDGKILVGGSFTDYNGVTQNSITRLNADGTRDTTFNIGTGFTGTVYTLAVQSDGKILVGGDFTAYNGTTQNRLIRLNADGTRDASFNVGTGFSGTVNSISIQSDGKILVGGAFMSYDVTSQMFITRLNTDGTIDATFNSGTGFSSPVNSLTLQSDGKILAGGMFYYYNGTAQNSLARLNTDGTVDTTFNKGAGFLGTVNSVAIQGDGKILVGGSFTSYDSQLTGSSVLLGW